MEELQIIISFLDTKVYSIVYFLIYDIDSNFTIYCVLIRKMQETYYYGSKCKNNFGMSSTLGTITAIKCIFTISFRKRV